MKNVCVIGTGYVGLVGAAFFADWGNKVVGVDIDQAKIDKINQGIMPIYEPGLDKIVLKNIKAKRLSFTTKLSEGVKNADIIFICVGTPQSEQGHADLSYVFKAAEDIAKLLPSKGKFVVVVTKSTVPVGTNEMVKAIIKKHAKKGVDFEVASNPEFLAEGHAVEDMKKTDRTVYGSDSPKALKVLRDFYGHLNSPLVECDLRTAEMIKYASNAMLATRISFINEIGQLCERAGANVEQVAYGMGLDKRIGKAFLKVSIGYGGSCFPKDIAALYRTSADQAYDFKLLRAVMEVNEQQKEFYIKKIRYYLGENLSGIKFGVLGLAFKEETDDIRESVPIKVIKELRGRGAEIKVFDPQAMQNAKAVLGDMGIYYAKDTADAVEGVNALCILTPWKEFGEISLVKFKKLMLGSTRTKVPGSAQGDKLNGEPVIFDGRNFFDKEEAEKAGFVYFGLGKPTSGLDKIKGIEPAHPFTAVIQKNGRL